jgi:hypothetical protein
MFQEMALFLTPGGFIRKTYFQLLDTYVKHLNLSVAYTVSVCWHRCPAIQSRSFWVGNFPPLHLKIGKRSSFQNVVYSISFRMLDNVQSPENHSFNCNLPSSQPFWISYKVVWHYIELGKVLYIFIQFVKAPFYLKFLHRTVGTLASSAHLVPCHIKTEISKVIQ